MNADEITLSFLILSVVVIAAFITDHHISVKRIESYLAHSHGYDASKEVGFYRPFDGREDLK